MARTAIPNYPNVTSIRLPDGFKAAVNSFLKSLNHETGVYMSRSEFMVVSTYWYLSHLMDMGEATPAEIQKHIKMFARDPKARPARSPEAMPSSSQATPSESDEESAVLSSHTLPSQDIRGDIVTPSQDTSGQTRASPKGSIRS